MRVIGLPTTFGEFSTEDEGDPCELAGEDDSAGRGEGGCVDMMI